MTFDDFRKSLVLVEDEIAGILDKWPELKQLIAYKYLYNLGHRIEGIDYKIDKLVREEWKREHPI